MRLLADESVDGPVVNRLRDEAHETDYIAEMRPGVSDDEVLTSANREGRILLTADKDFGELVFRQQRVTSGVVLIRLAGLSPEAKADTVAAALRDHADELPGNFTVISPGLVRIRRRFS